MKSPAISIITTVYNGMPFLQECIESVLIQDFQDWELLISDDNSSDDSRQYLDKLNDPRIHIYKQEKNLGIFGNLNFLFAKATAPISQILCQDDYFADKHSLSIIMNYWAGAPPKIGFVRFNHTNPSFPNRHLLTMQSEMLSVHITPELANILFFVFGNIPGNLSNISLRTHIVADLGNFNQSLPYAGDMEFWIRAANRFHMGVQKELVVFVRRHEKVASNFLNAKGELYQQHIIVYKHLIDKLSPNIDKKSLIMFFNNKIGAFHLRNALKCALYGNFSYLITFITTRSSILLPKALQLIVCLPYVIFDSRQKYTVKQARRLLKINYNNSNALFKANL